MPAPARIIAKLGSYEIVFRPEPAVRWSAAMFRILGLDPATKSLPAREYISRCDHPSDRSRVRNAVEHSLLKGTGHDLYCRIVCPDGSVRRIRCVAEPFDESVNARRRIIGTLADTTEWWDLGQKLSAMEARSRIAQEAVNNALKHARARPIRVRLLRKRNKVELQIDDDGPGLLVTRKSRQGRGLTIMLHHAQLIGASLALESEPRRGTPVTCHLPGPPILVLSMHDEKSFAERVLRAGARDYVTKDAGSAKVLEVIQQAAREARLDFFAPSPHHELKAAQADFHCRTGMVTPRHRSAGRGGRTRVLAHETLNFFTMPGPPFNPGDRSE